MQRGNTVNPMSKRKRTASSGSGTCQFDKLVRDLIVDILSRLSIKPLSNCLLVCKEWLSIIRDPRFAHAHSQKSPITILTYTNPSNGAQRKLVSTRPIKKLRGGGASHTSVERVTLVPQININIHKRFIEDFNITNSCNGLVCFALNSENDCYVFNPVLAEYITIPAPAPPSSPPGYFWYDFFALGFCSGTQEYKVLYLSCRKDDAEIYTIGTRVWRRLGKAPYTPDDDHRLPFNSFLHGALHYTTNGNDKDCGSELIQSFDFGSEEFRSLAGPPSLSASPRNLRRSGVLDGYLFLWDFDEASEKSEMWIMKDYGVQESWIKFLVFENLRPQYEPLMFLSNGEILMSSGARAVVRYNPEKKSLQQTRHIQTRSKFSATAYSPCIMSLHDVFRGEMVKSYRSPSYTKSF